MIDVKPSAPETPNLSRRPARRWLWGASLAAIAAVAVVATVIEVPEHSFRGTPQADAATPAPAPGVPVSVAVVTERDTPVWTDFSGRTEAVGRVEIRPRVAGAIIAARFREGALVKQGDLLFIIDPAPFIAEVQQSEAAVATASARLVLAIKEQQRGQQLVATSAMAQRELDQRVNELHAAEANLHAAQAALELSRLNLSYTQVRAPISGRVGRIDVTAGNLVAAGPSAPVLTTLVSVDPIYASFDADERSVARAIASLPPGGDLSDKVGRIPVQMGTLDTDGTPFLGRLQLIDNVVDAASGTVRVRAVLDNKDGRLMPGQFARLRLGEARTVPMISIDERAIGTDQDRRFVMVVGNDNKVAYRRVELGAMADGLRIVTSGLQSGERIVVSGLQRIRPGTVVAPETVAMKPSATPAFASR